MIHAYDNNKETIKRENVKNKNNYVKQFFNITKINVMYTFLLLLIFTYFFLIGLFDRNFYDPLNSLYSDVKKINNTTGNDKPTHISITSHSEGILLIFFALSISLVFGYIIQLLWIPSLVGNLIAGVIIRNIQVLNNIFTLPSNWSNSIRLLAFVIIMIRCGTGLKINEIKKYWLLSGSIGIVSTFFEAISIGVVSVIIFNFPPLYGVLFGFLIAATSPAITVPSMIELEEKQLSTRKGLPTILLVSASIDNLFSISMIYLLMAILFDLSVENNLTKNIITTILQLIGGFTIGIVIALIFYYVPKPTFNLFHTIRTYILIIVSFALFFTLRHFSFNISAPITVLIFSVVISIQWKKDNKDQIVIENQSLTHIWKLLFEPLLFLLIGYELDFNLITTSTIVIGLIFIGVGILGRIITVFFITLSSHLSILEGIYSCIAFIPKATVQAALVPLIYQASLESSNEKIHNNGNIIISTCIMSIIITAPLGRLLLLSFSNICLTSDEDEEPNLGDESGRRTVISNPTLGHWPNHVSYAIPPYYTNVYFPGY
uniref:Na_H_Exchanger domain-containing protein n=1 Tax=Parastrongyloides trichosuri TaxID=131310 RepID=A0A0N4ZH88_PARTI